MYCLWNPETHCIQEGDDHAAVKLVGAERNALVLFLPEPTLFPSDSQRNGTHSILTSTNGPLATHLNLYAAQ